MKINAIKTYYVVIINILTGSLISIIPLIMQGTVSGTYFVFGIALIVLPILMLYDKKNIRNHVQILTIINGFIAVTGLILLISGFVEIFVPLLIIGLYTPASFFGYEILKRYQK
jgi:hypothetical protein